MQLNIVAHNGLDCTEVYGSNSPKRGVRAGDFVEVGDGRILHIVSDGQRLRYGIAWWVNWEALKAQNTWVQRAIDQQEQHAIDEMAELVDLQATYNDMARQW